MHAWSQPQCFTGEMPRIELFDDPFIPEQYPKALAKQHIPYSYPETAPLKARFC